MATKNFPPMLSGDCERGRKIDGSRSAGTATALASNRRSTWEQTAFLIPYINSPQEARRR